MKQRLPYKTQLQYGKILKHKIHKNCLDIVFQVIRLFSKMFNGMSVT